MSNFYLYAILFALAILALGRFAVMPVRNDSSFGLQGILTALFLVLVLGGWFLATRGASVEDRLFAPIILPSPMEVLQAFPRLHFDQALVRSVVISFGRIASGFLLAALVAVPLGIQMGAYPKVAAFFRPLALIGSYVPIVVFIPLSLAWFGIGEMQKIGFLFIGCFVVLLPSVIRAIADVPDDYLNLATTKGAKQWQLVYLVLFPVAIPDIWSALRAVYGVGWSWIILAEIVNADRGIGYIISISERRGQTSSIYAIIIVICVIAVTCDQIWKRVGLALFPYKKQEE